MLLIENIRKISSAMYHVNNVYTWSSRRINTNRSFLYAVVINSLFQQSNIEHRVHLKVKQERTKQDTAVILVLKLLFSRININTVSYI